MTFTESFHYSKRMETTCAKCGAKFTRTAGRGRPRLKCDACRAGKVAVKKARALKVVAVPPTVRKRNPDVDRAIQMLDLVRNALTAMA